MSCQVLHNVDSPAETAEWIDCPCDNEGKYSVAIELRILRAVAEAAEKALYRRSTPEDPEFDENTDPIPLRDALRAWKESTR